MSVNPSDFLRAFVLAVTERLQRGESVSLPGVGTWRAARDPISRRVRIAFEETATPGAPSDPALARSVAVSTGAGQDEIDARISGYAGAIASHLADTGSVLIPGIGQLSGSPGAVSFRPEPLFEEAVDWDRPAASGQPTVPSPPPADPGLPEWANGPEDRGLPDRTPAETESVEPPEPEETAPAGEDTSGADQPTGAPVPVAEEPEPTVDDGVTTPPVATEPEPEDAGAPAPAPEAPAPERRPVDTPSARRSSPVRPLLAGAAVIVIAVVAIVLLRPGSEPAPEPTFTAEETPLPPDTLAVAAQTGSDTTTTSTTGPAVAPDSVESDSPPEASPEPATVAPPLPDPVAPAGQAFDTTAPGYTLIVGSTTSEDEALATMRRFDELGLPLAVLAYQEDGATRYRLAVGQYASAAEADQARQTLAERLPAGTWVRRIQP